jgi:hypothetical protein
MNCIERISRVRNAAIDGVDKTQMFINLSQQ